ncbi:M24 family metallopeptidase [Celeribacter sp.]|uniref:M24 family metallopeptidase n=1 Tax=Celeribacter sp. TaxID=1890673 RepID=UPI003A93DF4D
MDSFRAPFSALEYNRRVDLTRAAMDKQGLDVLIVTDPSNIAWLTGYDGWSFYTHQAVILSHEGAPLWWGRAMDANGAMRTVWMKPEDIVGYPDFFVQSTEYHPMEHLAGELAERGIDTGRVGVEMENYYYSAKAHAVFCGQLTKAEVVDATALVNWQRLVKSNEELEFMRRAATITDAAVTRALDLAEPGLAKNALVAEIYDALIRGAGDNWGDYPAIVPMLPSGPDATAPHLTWNGTELKHGEGTFFELSGCFRRYHAPLCRTVFFGTPPEEIATANEVLLEGMDKALEQARAGNRAADVAIALAETLEAAGYNRGARCGYPIGLSYPPDWGERTVSLRTTDETILKPGMCFHFMPGLWMDGWGLETTESIVITEDGGPELLCSVPRQLFVKD